jgi:metal-responsive CopG/Arc/MetJ family transcriptional regulator
MKSHRISVSIPKMQAEKLEKIAAEHGISMSQVVAKAINLFLFINKMIAAGKNLKVGGQTIYIIY